MPGQQIYVMPFSHLDLFWLGEREECLSRGNRIISCAVDICKQDASFRFLLEDMVFVKNYLHAHPERRAELVRLVRAGRIEVSPKYAGIYANMIPGEAHVRNLLHGKTLARELLGVDPQVAHQGDLPAHTPQYPQMLRQAGVPYAVICRLGPSHAPLFQWKGLDGSRVLTWFSAFSYSWGVRVKLEEGVEAARAAGIDQQIAEVMAQTPTPILMHWGVDLILPTDALLRTVEQWNRESDISMRLCIPSEFFHAVEMASSVPVIAGESPNGWGYPGSDPYPGDGRYLDGQAVAMLTDGERFSAIADLFFGTGYPVNELDLAWMRLLESMDHNAGGSGADEGNRRHLEYRRHAIFTGKEVLRRSLRPIAERVRLLADSDAIPLIVFNGTSWNRTDVVTAHVSVHGDLSAFQRDQQVQYHLLDPSGSQTPFQILQDRVIITRELRLAFRADDVPAMGYKAYYLTPRQESLEWPATCQVTDEGPCNTLRLETDELLCVLQKQTGAMSVYDKTLERWIVQGSSLAGEETDLDRRTHAFEHFPTGRRFELLVEQVDLVENGPVRARVVVRGILGSVKVEQEWLLCRGLRTLGMNLTITGPDYGYMPVALQQVFPTTIEQGRVHYGVPYGTNSFENVMPGISPREHNRDEANYDCWVSLREIQDWVDISNDSMGVTIATDQRMTAIEPPVIRSVLAFVNILPEPRSYHYEIHPHVGDWREARAYRWGAETATPCVVLSVNDPYTEKPFPPEQSFGSVSAENVVMTVLKRSQDGKRLVWRGYEAEGRGGSMALRLFRPLNSLVKTNLLEGDGTPVDAQNIPFGPYEIVTLAATIGE